MLVVASVLILFNVISSLVGLYVSGAKGRQPVEGFFFGLTFGPFGLLLAVLMPTVDEEEVETEEAEEDRESESW